MFVGVKVLLIFVGISSQMSGAKIRISERGDFMSGTTDRYQNDHFAARLNALL